MTTRVQGWRSGPWTLFAAGGADLLDWKNSVKAATAAPLPANTLDGSDNTLTADANGAFPAIDGVAIAVDESVLIKNEGGGTSPSNGIYVLTDAGSAGTPWVLTRRDDADTNAKVTAGMATAADQGTQMDTAWLLATNDPIDLNVTALTFVKFSANPLCDAAPLAIAAGAAGAAGTSGEVSRCDHEHEVPTGTPVATGTANAEGASTSIPRLDHVHETAVAVQDEGGGVGAFHTFNFIGDGIVAFDDGGGVTTVSVPGPGNPAVKEIYFMATDYGAEHGDFRVRNVSGTASFNFTFCIPDDFNALLSLDLLAIPDGTRADADIDLDSDYGQVGEQFDNHSETDTTSTFALVQDEIAEIDISSVFSALAAGDYCGLQVDNNISGPSFSVDYFGIRLRYTPV